jgi:phosphate transport system substrate-binding protein
MLVRREVLGVLAAVVVAVLPNPIQAQVKVDPKLPEFKAVQGVSGNLKIVGSDTMKTEMGLLSEGFAKFYPNVRFEIEGKGSATAPPALLDGTSQFAPMSRGMKAKEVDDFKKKYGYPPVALPTSIDMLEVYVHKDNPIKGLTLQQVDAVFSRTRKGGYAKAINTWGDLGLKGEWADKPITLYGRNKISGTNKFFLEHALFNGAFRDEVKEQLGSDAVVEHVANDKYAIGYSGMGSKSAGVKSLPLALDIKSQYIAPEPENAYSGDYPLTRMLLLYAIQRPGTELDPLRREFIRYLYSQQGQSDVLRSGFLPLGSHIATRALASVELDHWSPDAITPTSGEEPAKPAAVATADPQQPAPAAVGAQNYRESHGGRRWFGGRLQRRRVYVYP